MKKIFDWIVYSSANPEKISLTLKGAGVLIPTIIMLLSFLGKSSVSEIDLQVVLSSFTDTILAILAAVSAVASFVGLVRKIILSLVASK